MAKENSRMGTILVILVLLGLGILLYFLYNQNINKNMEEELERFQSRQESENDMTDDEEQSNNSDIEESFSNQMDYMSMDPQAQQMRNESNFPKEQLNADDLLPKDDSSLWAQVNPSGEGSLKDRNFLQSGYHIGINTVGQTLRNANQQLRSDPPCPQVKVSPWLQTTIEPDLGRKPMEIGGCN